MIRSVNQSLLRSLSTNMITEGSRPMMHSQMKFFRLCACCLFIMPLLGQAVHAEGVTRQQLQMLIPDQQDLQGFTRIRPAGAVPMSQASSQAEAIEDEVILDGQEAEYHPGWVALPGQAGAMSQIVRSFYSESGEFEIVMTMNVCDSPESAHLEVQHFLQACSTRFQKGTFSGAAAIGDESWFNPSGYSTLIGRAGRAVFLIVGSRSWLASRRGNTPRFPEAAVEAVAYQILLRASQQSALTGVPAQDTRPDAKGRTLPKNALWVAGRVYVPAREFAKAMSRSGGGRDVHAQGLTGEQLQALLPDEKNLPGFLRVAPEGEDPPIPGMDSPATPLHDQIWLPDAGSVSAKAGQGMVAQPSHSLGGMRRTLYSANGLYFIEMRVELCETREAAGAQLQDFLHGSSGIFNKGTFTGSSVIGDESLFLPADIYGSPLIFRAGNLFVLVTGRPSASVSRNGGHPAVFPPEAVEDLAYQILLRASQKVALTGVSSRSARLAVNGHTMSTGTPRPSP